MCRHQSYIFRSQFRRLKIVSAYNIPAVCCNGHVQENMLSSNIFTSIQGKTISWPWEFRVSLQNFRVSFWHPKRLKKTLVLRSNLKFERACFWGIFLRNVSFSWVNAILCDAVFANARLWLHRWCITIYVRPYYECVFYSVLRNHRKHVLYPSRVLEVH